MRQVFFYGAISLDGFLATQSDELQWLFDTSLDPDYDISVFEDRIDTVVMGNTTYRETQRLLELIPFSPIKKRLFFLGLKQGILQKVSMSQVIL